MADGVFNCNLSVLVNGSPTDEFKFADDTILAGEGTWSNLWAIKVILRGFEMVSGLRVNMLKSKLYGIEIEHYFLQAASQFLCCKVDSIPFKFLGVVVGGNPRRARFWNPILDNMKAKLSPWIGRLLSIGGRVALKKGVDWISWATVCKHHEDGGLGVKDLDLFNIALLTKWLWRLLNNHEPSWKGILEARYGTFHARILFKRQFGNKAMESTWWRDLMKIADNSEATGFTKQLSIKLGDGVNEPFWTIRWIGQSPLCDTFPVLFQGVENKKASVQEMGDWVENIWQWRWE
ncbi:uncharacterized protein LOC131621636 [Vicia villosa]|uniref:uncharacterized protein LOC131621636 n=1 Tax=Vicia villosa TaxID=3911 RepID=UPI00273CE79B|nr:uncharacterized protein LOC131621636 [Vicia villosa]